MASYTVVFDSCVLYPAPLRDLLIQLTAANLFRAKWTEQIHEEWITSVLRNRSDIARDKLERTKSLMNEAIPDCLVAGYEYLIPSLNMPDPGDLHVLAAAIHARADAIVTFNLKDFPNTALASHNLEAIHPDEFINFQIDLDEAAVVTAAQACCNRLKNPPKSAEEYLAILEAQSLPKTVAILRKYRSLLSTLKKPPA